MKSIIALGLILYAAPCLSKEPLPTAQVGPLKPQEEPDYGPEILIGFLRTLPGLITMASGQKSDDPELAAVGFQQFAQGFAGFLGSLEKVINRKPNALKQLRETIILQEDFVNEALEEGLASKEGKRALRSWKRSLKGEEAFLEEKEETEKINL